MKPIKCENCGYVVRNYAVVIMGVKVVK